MKVKISLGMLLVLVDAVSGAAATNVASNEV